MTTLARQLKAIGACKEAVLWAKDYKTLRSAWEACERGDWMLWLCAKMEGKKGWSTRQQIVLVACDCAELVLPIYEKKYPDDKRVRNCIEVTRKWANGKATIEEVRQARRAAYATPTPPHADAAARRRRRHAAYAAADAAYAAYAATPTPPHAAARLRTYKQCAEFCRKRLAIPKHPRFK